MTLNDYANEREYVVLFFAGLGYPTGDHTLIGYPDIDFAERRCFLDLEGEVDGEGDWRWNGKGNPRDDRANSITQLHAYVNKDQWQAIRVAYEVC